MRFPPDQLEDASFPDGHQFDEALETLGRVMVTVCVNVERHDSDENFQR
jgi:hypothetical protein